jgi:hypothetical protein
MTRTIQTKSNEKKNARTGAGPKKPGTGLGSSRRVINAPE